MFRDYVSNSKSVKAELGPLIEEWQDYVIRYCKIHADCGLHNDLPWAYNERASVSVLAAAAWKLKNGCALEEYRDRKRDVSRKDKRTGRSKEVKGRVDLYVCNQVGTGIAMEAKQIETIIRIPAKLKYFDDLAVDKRNIGHAMARAWKSTKRLRADTADKRYSLTFVAPIFRLESSKGERGAIDAAVNAWLQSLKDYLVRRPKSEEILGAWVFPPQARQGTPSVATGRSGRYRFDMPGVVA